MQKHTSHRLWLNNMFPMFSFKNCMYSGSTDTIFIRKHDVSIFKRLIFYPYFSNLIFSKDMLRQFFTSCFSSLGKHIQSIIFWSTNSKMFRICTRRVVAFMQNPFSFWYFPKVNFPGNAMSLNWNRRSFASRNLTISMAVRACFPFPTRISFYNFHPESFLNCGWFSDFGWHLLIV